MAPRIIGDHKVRKAVQRQGECWRIALLPRSLPEMISMIATSKAAVGNREIYYYDRITGTHFLTYQEFTSLESLRDAELRRHLIEIRDLSKRFNRLGMTEIRFFMADEIVIEDPAGIPSEIVAADQTGTFVDYLRKLEESAAAYARPIIHRGQYVADPERFARVYLDAFTDRFTSIQREYEKRRRAFDTLFLHERRDESGSFAYRWERVLARMQRTDVQALTSLIEERCQSGE